MIQGMPQDQIPEPTSEGVNSTTAIPMQAVSPDQLPHEKGLTYDEVCRVIGSLYLDSHHQMQVREDQFQAMAEEYEKRVLQAQAEREGHKREVDNLVKEVSRLRRELETTRNGRSEPRPSSPSSDDGDNSLPDNG